MHAYIYIYNKKINTNPLSNHFSTSTSRVLNFVYHIVYPQKHIIMFWLILKGILFFGIYIFILLCFMLHLLKAMQIINRKRCFFYISIFVVIFKIHRNIKFLSDIKNYKIYIVFIVNQNLYQKLFHITLDVFNLKP